MLILLNIQRLKDQFMKKLSAVFTFGFMFSATSLAQSPSTSYDPALIMGFFTGQPTSADCESFSDKEEISSLNTEIESNNKKLVFLLEKRNKISKKYLKKIKKTDNHHRTKITEQMNKELNHIDHQITQTKRKIISLKRRKKALTSETKKDKNNSPFLDTSKRRTPKREDLLPSQSSQVFLRGKKENKVHFLKTKTQSNSKKLQHGPFRMPTPQEVKEMEKTPFLPTSEQKK